MHIRIPSEKAKTGKSMQFKGNPIQGLTTLTYKSLFPIYFQLGERANTLS